MSRGNRTAPVRPDGVNTPTSGIREAWMQLVDANVEDAALATILPEGRQLSSAGLTTVLELMMKFVSPRRIARRRPSSLGPTSRLGVEMLERREVLSGNGVFALITLQTNVGDIQLEMRDDAAPGTVDNFVNYIEDGDYLGAIFHRVLPNFVMQGGGFRASQEVICNATTCTPDNVDTSLFNEIPDDDPIVNEFEISNIRGTVAMAKLGGNPDSATNQFFFNLNDNSGNLDNQNGGFTVFAEAVDMTVVDSIVAMNTLNLSANFPGSSLGAIVATPVDGNRIVRVEGIEVESVISGCTFLDIDSDGVRDPRESGIENRIVYIDANNDGFRDSRETYATTDEQGNYFLRVEPGEYTIRTDSLSDFDDTTPSQRRTVTARPGRNERITDFGLHYSGNSWTNPLNETDVNAVDGVNPLDALVIINELNNPTVFDPETHELPATNTETDSPRFMDVQGDGFLSPIDALRVINELNARSSLVAPSGITESAVDWSSDRFASSIDTPFSNNADFALRQVVPPSIKSTLQSSRKLGAPVDATELTIASDAAKTIDSTAVSAQPLVAKSNATPSMESQDADASHSESDSASNQKNAMTDAVFANGLTLGWSGADPF